MLSKRVMIYEIVPLLLVFLIIGLGAVRGQTTGMIGEKYDNISASNQTLSVVSKNPNFTFFNSTSGIPANWSDPSNSCKNHFSCTIQFTDGWNDYVSFGISTINSTHNIWSSIVGSEIKVKPHERIQLVSHMKLNKWATQSHIAIDGFNETSRKWYQVIQCPSGTNGPMEWREFSCTLIIPPNIAKIKVILNAGWSSDAKREATTWFDSIDVLG